MQTGIVITPFFSTSVPTAATINEYPSDPPARPNPKLTSVPLSLSLKASVFMRGCSKAWIASTSIITKASMKVPPLKKKYPAPMIIMTRVDHATVSINVTPFALSMWSAIKGWNAIATIFAAARVTPICVLL